MRRVNVVGTSGSGKTTYGAALARRLGVPHVELDALSWEANWVSVAPAVLRERVVRAVAADEWVVDGNYSATRDLVWGRADTVVWLDFPFALVMWRVIARTLRRSLRGDVLWSGNRESVRLALSRDSIILWARTTFHRRRRDYPRLFREHPGVRFVRLRSPTQARRFLEAIASPVPAPVSGPRSRPGPRSANSPAGGATMSGAPGRQ
jgi:adenylate kinase family enzyme